MSTTRRTWALVLGAALVTACPGEGGTDSETGGSTGADSTTAAATTTAATTQGGSTAGTSTGDEPTTNATTAAATTGDPGDVSATAANTGTTTAATTAGTTGEPPPAGCNAAAIELIALVNAYRGENGLPAIPASPSLCTVGQAHVEDLEIHAPHTEPGCNLHSWSDAGPWSACCYTDDHAQAACMWNKPKEMTVYPGSGYENASAGFGSPQAALDGWKSSPAHNDVILNKGIWKDFPWGAIGAGVNQGYAVLWFGVEADPAG